MNEDEPTPDQPTSGVDLDPDELSPGALRGIVEEYVTREGTDYGQGNWSLEEKVSQVFRQLQNGDARIVFDLELESASIVTRPELALHVLDVTG
ncbi:YheU family protein [Myxococcota bacterium]|nr:YheU family protein [Myxococcota bacterium]